MSEPILTSDPAGEPFFMAAARGELAIRRCPACRRHLAPIDAVCQDCGACTEWVTAAGDAVLVSWVGPGEDTAATGVPALVELAEGPWLHTRVQADPGTLRAGLALRVHLVHPAEGESYPVFRPAAD